jgi:hypothetical protein
MFEVACRCRRSEIMVAALAALAATGCGGKASVSGTVTYEGQPVAAGVVVFLTDGAPAPYPRSDIKNGRYSVTNLVPGKKKVQVAAPRKFFFPSEKTEQLPPPTPDFPDDAEGNGQEVELRAGSNTINIDLKKPAGKKK